MVKILQRGAEAVLILDKNKIIKERIEKNYRIKEIDEKLRKRRTKKEAKLLEKVDFAPNVLNSNEFNIEMEFIDGKLVKDVLDNLSKKERIKMCEQIGEKVATIHDQNIIHGDLTTSNMVAKNEKIFFIDFGLGFVSRKFEDRAVDLHLLRQALESKHYQNYDECYKAVLKGYKKSKDYKEVMKRITKVELRGRYKRKNK